MQNNGKVLQLLNQTLSHVRFCVAACGALSMCFHFLMTGFRSVPVTAGGRRAGEQCPPELSLQGAAGVCNHGRADAAVCQKRVYGSLFVSAQTTVDLHQCFVKENVFSTDF